MAVVVQRLERTVVVRETRVRLSPSACEGNQGFLPRYLPNEGVKETKWKKENENAGEKWKLN